MPLITVFQKVKVKKNMCDILSPPSSPSRGKSTINIEPKASARNFAQYTEFQIILSVPIILNRFWPLLKQTSFSDAAGAI